LLVTFSAGFSSGAKSSRYMTGWKMPTKTHVGWRSSSSIWREKISQVSRRNFTSVSCGESRAHTVCG
jgi:hypothetical protein